MNGAELIVVLLVAVIVVGPERLPAYAEQLAGWVRSLRAFVRSTKERVADELGEGAQDVDWASLDPRRYDPRRIVREALLDEPPAVTGRTYRTTRQAAVAGGSTAAATGGVRRGGPEGTGTAGAADPDAARPDVPGTVPAGTAAAGATRVAFDPEAT